MPLLVEWLARETLARLRASVDDASVGDEAKRPTAEAYRGEDRERSSAPSMQRLPDWVTVQELAAILGWGDGAILEAVAYGHLLGAELREDGYLHVARDAVHAWLRQDWQDSERARASRQAR
jgi:hypothetical protein